jgi:hypothetical protein
VLVIDDSRTAADTLTFAWAKATLRMSPAVFRRVPSVSFIVASKNGSHSMAAPPSTSLDLVLPRWWIGAGKTVARGGMLLGELVVPPRDFERVPVPAAPLATSSTNVGTPRCRGRRVAGIGSTGTTPRLGTQPVGSPQFGDATILRSVSERASLVRRL